MATRERTRTDPLTPEQRRYTMSRVRGKDTKPEFVVRRLAHAMGYRYRLHVAALPGKPDMVFAGRRKVIFIHGCFWHGHDCRAGRKRPQSNQGYWLKKLERNAARDIEHRAALEQAGWQVLILWECELKDAEELKKKLAGFLE